MKETMVDTTVTYTLEHGGKLVVVEHVPARVCGRPANSSLHRRLSNTFNRSSMVTRSHRG